MPAGLGRTPQEAKRFLEEARGLQSKTGFCTPVPPVHPPARVTCSGTPPKGALTYRPSGEDFPGKGLKSNLLKAKSKIAESFRKKALRLRREQVQETWIIHAARAFSHNRTQPNSRPACLNGPRPRANDLAPVPANRESQKQVLL